MKTLVSGSMAYDLLLGYEGAFADGLDAKAADDLSMAFVTPYFAKHHGGTGVNIAWSLRLLGGDPLLVSTVGKDGGAYTALIEERGINTGYIEQLDDHMTATAIIGTDNRENQIIFFHPGADAHGSLPDLSQDRDDLSYAIVSPRNQTLMMEMLRWCHEYGVPCLFDPGQQMMAFSDDDLERAVDLCTGVIGNEHEWNLLTERLNTTEGDLLKRVEYIVVTKGDKGLTIYTQDDEINIAGCKAEKVINPTGAGDALRAGLLKGLSSGWSLRDAGRLGAAMGSFVVEIEGTLLETLDEGILEERLKNAYG
ncbi:MAG: carbohydrate kinase family protein [bacterium]|nr:carbohydrate kinase family protein [bacterium]